MTHPRIANYSAEKADVIRAAFAKANPALVSRWLDFLRNNPHRKHSGSFFTRTGDPSTVCMCAQGAAMYLAAGQTTPPGSEQSAEKILLAIGVTEMADLIQLQATHPTTPDSHLQVQELADSFFWAIVDLNDDRAYQPGAPSWPELADYLETLRPTPTQ